MSDINNNKKETNNKFNWNKLIILSLSSIILGLYRDGFSALFPFIQRDFSLSRAELGFYISSLYLVASIAGIFSGRLVDIKGAKWGMSTGIFFIGILLLIHAITPNYTIFLILAGFAGFALSLNAPAANKGIAEWFPIKWRGTATGIWSTSLPIGGLIAAVLLPNLGTAIGWRNTILVPALLSIICTVIILKYYQDNNIYDFSEKNQSKKEVSFWKGIGNLLNNLDFIAISIYGFFLGALTGAISSHFVLFLFLDYGLSEGMAGFAFAAVQLGSILSRPGWGIMCDRLLKANKRKAFLYIGISFVFMSLILGIFLKNINPSLLVIFILSFLTGWTGRGWQGIYFASIPELVKEKQIGVAIGLSLLFLRVGMLLSPPVFGYIADIRGAYDLSWLILGFIIFITSIGQYLFYLKYKKPKIKKSKKKIQPVDI